MLKYGILSTASIIDRFIKGIRESEHGEVFAIASRTVESAEKAAKRLGIETYYGSYEELYKDPEVDIIYIPTMNGIHYQNCMDALSHHKHVIVEKPFALTKKQAEKMFAHAKEMGCFLMEAQKIAYLPTTKKTKDLLTNNVIGNIKYIVLEAGFPSRFDYDHWMFDLTKGGGALYGSATYTIEYMKLLFDEPDLTMNAQFIEAPTGSDDLCHFTLKINDQIMMASTIAMNVTLKNEAVFYGEKGCIRVPNYWKADKVILELYGEETQVFNFPCTSEFRYEVDHINQCIEEGYLESPVMHQRITIDTTAMVEETYQKWKGSDQ